GEWRAEWSARATPQGPPRHPRPDDQPSENAPALLGHGTGAPTACPPSPRGHSRQSTLTISGPRLLQTRAAFACDLGSTTDRPWSRRDFLWVDCGMGLAPDG